ncbi:MAG: ArsR/SmtB family transcription factor [Hyphomonas sp.]|jgi:ArsR family transcriptional regulator
MKQTTLDPNQFRERAGEAARLLKAMASEHRLMILCRLGGGEMTVGQLLQGTTLSQSALSQHLAVLREDGLVVTRREGQSIFYRIADPAAVRLIETLADIFCPEE